MSGNPMGEVRPEINDDDHQPTLPRVFERDGIAETNSLDVADFFGKSHGHILRDIRDIVEAANGEHASKIGLMFKPAAREVIAGNGARRLDADEKGIAISDTPGGLQEMVAVTESGLYALIFRSRKPAAVRFRKWVTSEVLPSIRSGGSYSIPDTDAPERSETEAGKLRFVVETRMTWGEKAAQQMWLKKGLPTVPAMFEGRQLPLPLDGEG